MSDASARTRTPEPIKKLMQLQIERLKKEDDEEQWISGEELYTEGSSDEDDTASRVKRKGRDERVRMHRKMKEMRERVDVALIRGKHLHRKEPYANECIKNTVTTNTSKDSVQDKREVKKTEETKPEIKEDHSNRLIETGDSENPVAEEDKAEVFGEASGGAMLSKPEISWRPKRGSIKLPSLNYEGRQELVSNSQVQ